jgi:hypothetical protein
MNTYHYAPFSKMFSPLKVFYKITPNVEGKPIQLTHKKIHVPRSYREYVRTLNNARHSFHPDEIDAEAEYRDQDEEQDWGFFVDTDHVSKVVQRQKPQPPIKIKYSYYKYVQRFTYFSANKIVHEDEKYSSVDAFDTIVCGDCGNYEDEEKSIKEPSTIVRQTPSSTYIYQEILKRIRPSSQNTGSPPRPCSRRWYYKVMTISLFVITCITCAAFIACIAVL